MASIAKIFASPRRYIQGAGVLRITGEQIKFYGTKPLIIGGTRGLTAAAEAGLFKSLEQANINYVVEKFGTPPYGEECTWKEINRLSRIATEKGCDLVMSVGGGKVIDTGKVVAYKIGKESVMIPTSAATNAATSAFSLIYTEDHIVEQGVFFFKNPALVIVDSAVIAKAPLRYLISGMGDAAAAKFEGEMCYRTGAKNYVTQPDRIGFSTFLSLSVCKLAYDNLREYGEAAIEAVANKIVTPALETVIESIILWSGLGWENTGCAAAHSINNGLTSLVGKIPEEIRPMHGELVNFGTCCQLIMENRPRREVLEHYKWSHKIGLPLTFEGLGFSEKLFTDEDLWGAAEKACAKNEPIHNMYFEVTPEIVFYAMKAANELGKKLKRSLIH
jgi:glycerol dehydrogenase